MNKIQITPKQALQYNIMLNALKTISKSFQTTDQIRRNSEKDYGLDYVDALEMSYENIQVLAKSASKNVKSI
ncbi:MULTISPECIES: hypothetical protein [unclassified Sphingobacterium]|uniref:hypothetical protein n=1 Tax=unclassified Sphingobacterium TaxID=2609468 RepID=UPI0025CC0265|nr:MULTISPECIES: hypothetical protein [unclassified Sphingobacterium]